MVSKLGLWRESFLVLDIWVITPILRLCFDQGKLNGIQIWRRKDYQRTIINQHQEIGECKNLIPPLKRRGSFASLELHSRSEIFPWNTRLGCLRERCSILSWTVSSVPCSDSRHCSGLSWEVEGSCTKAWNGFLRYIPHMWSENIRTDGLRVESHWTQALFNACRGEMAGRAWEVIPKGLDGNLQGF